MPIAQRRFCRGGRNYKSNVAVGHPPPLQNYARQFALCSASRACFESSNATARVHIVIRKCETIGTTMQDRYPLQVVALCDSSRICVKSCALRFFGDMRERMLRLRGNVAAFCEEHPIADSIQLELYRLPRSIDQSLVRQRPAYLHRHFGRVVKASAC